MISTHLLSFLLGVVAGLRAVTAPAAASISARLGWLPTSGTPLAFMGYRWTPLILGVAAAAELVADQLSTTPSRKVPVQLGTRLVAGALAGATFGAGREALVRGGLLGVAGAAVGTFVGAAGRAHLAAHFGRDLPAALLEDVVAVGGVSLVVAAA